MYTIVETREYQLDADNMGEALKIVETGDVDSDSHEFYSKFDQNSGEVEQRIKELVSLYQQIVKREIAGMTDEGLLQLADSRSSRWSGGFSVSNMLEQIIRQAAIDKLRKNPFE